MYPIYSIGHSNKPIEQFLKELKDHDVTLVVDVRSQPYSRHVPQYNKDNLKPTLEDEGIDYLYFGDKLGGRPREGLDAFIRSDRFKENVSQLLEKIWDDNAAIMCSEAEHENCHRRFIVDEIRSRGHEVKIIERSTPKGTKTNTKNIQQTFDEL